MLNLNQKYRVDFDDDTISQSGIQEINRYIASQNLRDNKVWGKFLPDGYDPYWIGKRFLPPLPEDWVWLRNYVPKDKSDPIRGYFAKRVEKYYRSLDFKGLPDSFKTRIGTLVDDFVSKSGSHIIQLTDNLDWNAGDFGDTDSCFWGGRKKARQLLKHIGALALQSFDINDPTSGRGRCWVIPDFPERGTYCLFNGYGYGDGTDALRILAKVFAKQAGMEQKKVVLTNKGEYNGTLWINHRDGVSRGIIVAPHNIISNIVEGETYDFNYSLESVGVCAISGDEIWGEDDYLHICGGRLILAEYLDRTFECPLCRELDILATSTRVRTNRFRTNCDEDGYVEICHDCVNSRLVFDEIYKERILDVDAMYVNGDNLVTSRQTFFENCGICEVTNLAFLNKNLVSLHGGHQVSVGAYYHLKNTFVNHTLDESVLKRLVKTADSIFGQKSGATTAKELVDFVCDNVDVSVSTKMIETIFSNLYMEALAFINAFEVTYA